MGTLRSETYYSGEYLINALRHTGTLQRMLHDGGDIILFENHANQQISIQLIESGIPLYEIRKIVADNHAKGIYSLFMLWCSMMVPPDGKLFKMDDWMAGFVALNGDRIYAYDIFDGEVFLFPVFFRGEGPVRQVEYGTTVRAGRIQTREIHVTMPGLEGTWRVAYFDEVKTSAQDVLTGAVPLSGLEACYALLGVEPGDDRETIKAAYRMLARRFHPDVNTAPDANEYMIRLNKAYETILDSLS